VMAELVGQLRKQLDAESDAVGGEDKDVPDGESPNLDRLTEAEPKRVPLRSCIESAVAASAVKGQDERPPDALDSARRHSRRCAVQSRKAATSALTFMTFS
jgi:hypothetical protein